MCENLNHKYYFQISKDQQLAMNIQTSRAIYDMPIISPQHAHWRAVRKLFDKKVQVVHHRFQRIFNLNDGTAESGGGREA